MRNEVQVIMYSLSADAITRSTSSPSCRLCCHYDFDIPWNGPVAAVRVGRVDGQFVAQPHLRRNRSIDLDLRIAVRVMRS